jgi:hypothetical protein
MAFFLRIAALILFILAIIAELASGFGHDHALAYAGLACWVASTLVPARVP